MKRGDALRRTLNARFVGASILAIIAAAVAGPTIPAAAKPPLKLAIQRQQARNEYTRFEEVIDWLGPTPGMTVLDIGAGPGYASFLFAEKLRGTGQVFATDIRKDFVDRIADVARQRGLANLHSALVKERGLDEFYGRHRYDLVFLSNVYHCLEDPVGYFGALRAFMKPGARLVLVIYNQAPLYSEDDLDDLDGLVESLSSAAGDDPFVGRLSPATRRLLDAKGGTEGLGRALVDDFNRMLVDPAFHKSFYKDSYFTKDLFTPPERELANWLLMTLRDNGILERPADAVDAEAMRTVIKLNRLFFRKRFGDYLANDGEGAYIPAGDANRQTSRRAALRELDAAGFRFVKEMRVSPFFDAVVMAPKVP